MSKRKLMSEAIDIIRNGVPPEPTIYIVEVTMDGEEICKNPDYPDKVNRDVDTVIRLIHTFRLDEIDDNDKEAKDE